jgi:uncharacterized membrane protein
MNSEITRVLTQLLMQAPVLVTLLVGVILALAFWRRCPSACLFALTGFGLLLFQGFVFPIINAILLHGRINDGWSTATYGQIASIVGFAGSLLRMAGFIFLVLAVFTGRRPAPPDVPPPL